MNAILRISLLAMVIAILFVIIDATSVSAINRVVDDDVGPWADNTTIQDAIDASSDDDVIYVYEGVYNENVYVDVEVTLIGNGTEFTIIDCEGSGSGITIVANNVEVSGFTIWNTTTTSANAGILTNGVSGLDIHDNNASGNGQDGMLIIQTTLSNFVNNTANSNGRTGFYLSECSNLNLDNNTAMDNGFYGFHFWLTHWSSASYCNADENDYYGMYFQSSSNNSVMDSTANSNYFYGIRISASSWDTYLRNNASSNGEFGLYFFNSDNCTASNNTLSHNGDEGVRIAGSRIILITYNEIFNNTDYGVHVQSDSDNNTIHHNNFLGNQETKQGYDNGDDTAWDDGSEGNYWSDYIGEDGNGDGIGDTPYYLQGTSNSQDDYPLMDPAETEAPEKVPEIGALIPIMFGLFFLFVIVRRTNGK